MKKNWFGHLCSIMHILIAIATSSLVHVPNQLDQHEIAFKLVKLPRFNDCFYVLNFISTVGGSRGVARGPALPFLGEKRRND